jgi:hypothetical protein
LPGSEKVAHRVEPSTTSTCFVFGPRQVWKHVIFLNGLSVIFVSSGALVPHQAARHALAYQYIFYEVATTKNQTALAAKNEPNDESDDIMLCRLAAISSQ